MSALAKISLAFAFASLTGCEWYEEATADRPNSTQRDAIADTFSSTASFVTVVGDPDSASTGDMVDMHSLDPYRNLLDPDGAVAARKAPTSAPPGCIEVDEDEETAQWDCYVDNQTCVVAGSGVRNSDGSYSGESELSCAGADVVFSVVAENVRLDEELGTGSGELTIGRTSATDSESYKVTYTDLSFCLDQSPPLPNGGTLKVEGVEGDYAGESITLEFDDSPACGDTVIVD